MKYVLRSLFILMVAVALPSLASAKEEKAPANVMQVIEERKDLARFADMIKEAGLEKEFESKNQYTVFAPSNDAIGKMPSEVSKKIKSDKAALQTFVKYHAISGSVVYFTNIKGRRAGPAAMSGETLGFEGTGEKVKVNTAGFTVPDLPAPNGVVHVMDAVLTPPSFTPEANKRPEPQLPAQMKHRAPPPATATQDHNTSPAIPEAPAVPDMPAAPAVETPAVPEAMPAPVPSTVTPTPPAPAQQPKKESGGWLKKLLGK